MKKRILILAALMSGLAVCGLHAELLVYEGFEYPAGETLGGKNGGTGWTGSWNTNPQMIQADSLNLPNILFAPKGGSVYTVGGNTVNRNFAGIDFSQDGVYYISYLCRRTGWTSATSGEWLDFHLRTSSWGQVATWGISSSENFHTYNVGSNIATPGADSDEVFFMVGKLVTKAEGNDEISLKAYTAIDTIPTIEPLAWTVSGGVVDKSDLATMVTFWPGSSTSYKAEFDEIRIGTTWAAVVAPAKSNRVVYLSPSADSEVISPISFSWHAPTDIAEPSYELFYSTVYEEVDPNVAPHATAVTLSETGYGPISLDAPATYYWRVDIVYGSNRIVGEISSFSTIVPIYPISPVSGANNQPRNLTLTWDTPLGITGNYNVYIGQSPETLNFVGVSDGKSYSPLGLEWGNTYYWKVVYDDGVDLVESITWDFTLAEGPVCDGSLSADFTGNCITNLADFAMLAAEWMNCTAVNADDCY